MRTSAFTSVFGIRFPRRQQCGFTLIEIMLVLVIIGIVIGLAGLALDRNPARDLDREGRRLRALLAQASDEAVMQGEELALALSKDPKSGANRYELLQLDKQTLQWQRPRFDGKPPELWSVHSLAPDIALTLDLEGDTLSERQLQQLGKIRSLRTPDGLRPSILLMSSGEITPFSLHMSWRGSDYSVAIQSDGFSGVFLQ